MLSGAVGLVTGVRPAFSPWRRSWPSAKVRPCGVADVVRRPPQHPTGRGRDGLRSSTARRRRVQAMALHLGSPGCPLREDATAGAGAIARVGPTDRRPSASPDSLDLVQLLPLGVDRPPRQLVVVRRRLRAPLPGAAHALPVPARVDPTEGDLAPGDRGLAPDRRGEVRAPAARRAAVDPERRRDRALALLVDRQLIDGGRRRSRGPGPRRRRRGRGRRAALRIGQGPRGRTHPTHLVVPARPPVQGRASTPRRLGAAVAPRTVGVARRRRRSARARDLRAARADAPRRPPGAKRRCRPPGVRSHAAAHDSSPRQATSGAYDDHRSKAAPTLPARWVRDEPSADPEPATARRPVGPAPSCRATSSPPCAPQVRRSRTVVASTSSR